MAPSRKTSPKTISLKCHPRGSTTTDKIHAKYNGLYNAPLINYFPSGAVFQLLPDSIAVTFFFAAFSLRALVFFINEGLF